LAFLLAGFAFALLLGGLAEMFQSSARVRILGFEGVSERRLGLQLQTDIGGLLLRRRSGLTKQTARFEAELVKRATEIERLRTRLEVLGEAGVKHELARRDLQQARTRLSDLEKQRARLTRELERSRERLAIAKVRKPAVVRAKRPTRPCDSSR